MRILFLFFPLEPAIGGGAEAHTLALAAGLRQAGHEIFLVSSDQNLVVNFSALNLQAECAWMGWEPTSVKALLLFKLTWLTAFFKFRAILRRLRPDAVFCLTLTDKLLATAPARKRRCKVFWIEHTRLARWLFKNPLLFWYRRSSRRARIIAPSYFLRNQLIQAGVAVDNITVINHGIALPLNPAQPPAPSAEKFTIGFLGRLKPEKGAAVLLRAVSNLPKNFYLLIAGDGPNKTELMSLAQTLGIFERIEFLGHVKDKFELFSKIQVLVVPSILAEAFGLVVLDAASAGVPVIASRIGALGEIVGHQKTGLLFEPGNANELAKQLQFLADHPTFAQSLTAQAWLTAKKRFTYSRMLSAYFSLLG